MKKIFKCLAAVLISAATAFTATALPAFPVTDLSGEFAYYQDFTFTDPSYIGVIYYSESAYGFRFYSPATEERTEKDITVYLSVDPDNEKLTLTGETVKGAYYLEDADIINYLHDMMYEFTARRRKLEIGLEPYTSTEDFMQFGGLVYCNWNTLVPIFNLESISKTDGSPLLSLVTTGRIVFTEDPTFDNFKGIASLPQDKEHSYTKPKKTKKLVAEYKDLSVKLDTSWERCPSTKNMWQSEVALVAMKYYSLDDLNTVETDQVIHDLERQTRESISESYKLWSMIQSSQNGNSYTVTTLSSDFESGNVLRSFNVFVLKDTGIAVFTLNVFDSCYKADKKYYDNIIKSFTAK